MKRKIFILMLVFLIIPISSIAGVRGSPCPIEYVRDISDQIIEILNTTEGNLTLDQFKQIREKLHDFIDREKLAELVLGENFYNKLSLEQKIAFQEELFKHISTNYLLKINRERDGQGKIEIKYCKKIPYKTIKRNGKTEELCIVKTRIKKQDGYIGINLHCTYKNGGWPAYNISVDLVKMLGNFRSQFKSYIKKGKTPAQIIAIVKEKVAKLEANI
jgi:ABC-type transporter MlaC component